MDVLLALAVALLFAAVHLFGGRITLRETPRSVWLSLAGGVSVAYVFVHLLPELAEHQEAVARTATGPLEGLEAHAYVAALVGLALFYGLERLAKSPAGRPPGDDDRSKSSGVFWLHIGAFALYNALIGYLLLHREQDDLGGLATYAAAMALHFVVNDHGLRAGHGDAYDRAARWILAAAPLAGWGVGLATDISQGLLGLLFAFLAGGVVLNVLKEELPDDRESRFWAFALGSAAYAALLLAAA